MALFNTLRHRTPVTHLPALCYFFLAWPRRLESNESLKSCLFCGSFSVLFDCFCCLFIVFIVFCFVVLLVFCSLCLSFLCVFEKFLELVFFERFCLSA